MYNYLLTLKERLKPHAIPLLLLCLVTLAVYAPSLHHEFLTNWDDNKYITANEAVRGFTFAHIASAFSSFYVGNYAPLQILSYMLDYEIWGLRASGFILTNILLHLTNGLLFFRLLHMHAFSRLAAFVAVFIFLLHPVQVESVAWISQRKNLLAMLLFLLSFICYVAYTRRQSGEKGHTSSYLIALAAFSGALLAKSVAIVLPAALLLYDYCYVPGAGTKKSLVDKIPFLLIALLVGVVTILAQRYDINGGGGRTGYYGGGPYQTFLTMLPVMLLYLKLLLFPVELSALYSPEIMTGITLKVVGAGLIVMLLIAFGIRLVRSNRPAAFWYLLFFLCLAPVAQIIPLVTLINDRYLYFPLLGAAALSGFLVSLVGSTQPVPGLSLLNERYRRFFCLLLIVPLLALPYLSLQRAAVWQNAVTLWTDTSQKVVSNETLYDLADAYLGRNDQETAQKLLRTVLDRDPLHRHALSSLALLYMQKNNVVAARTLLLKLTAAHPNFALGFQSLGNNYYMRGDLPLAEKNYRQALKIKPDMPQTLVALGNILLARRALTEADSSLTKALRLDSRNPHLYYSLACLRSLEGDAAAALTHLETALRLGFRNKEAIIANSELNSINQRPEFNTLMRNYFP